MKNYDYTTSSGQKLEFDGDLIAETNGAIDNTSLGKFEYLLQCHRVFGKSHLMAVIVIESEPDQIFYLAAQPVMNLNDLREFFFQHSFLDIWTKTSRRFPKQSKLASTASKMQNLYLHLALKIVATLEQLPQFNLKRVTIAVDSANEVQSLSAMVWNSKPGRN